MFTFSWLNNVQKGYAYCVFVYLSYRTGLALQPLELDRIWATLNVSTDGMYTYSTLIQHFVHYKIPPEEKENIVYGKLPLLFLVIIVKELLHLQSA